VVQLSPEPAFLKRSNFHLAHQLFTIKKAAWLGDLAEKLPENGSTNGKV
jgi:hypothetical protein